MIVTTHIVEKHTDSVDEVAGVNCKQVNIAAATCCPNHGRIEVQQVCHVWGQPGDRLEMRGLWFVALELRQAKERAANRPAPSLHDIRMR
jgi:hypothetical protein